MTWKACLFAFALSAFTSLAAARDAKATAPVEPPPPSSLAPWDRSFIDLEAGYLWKVGGDTPLDYGMVPVMLSWRSREALGLHFDDGSALIVRNRLTLLGQWVETGPENHYFGIMGAPSIEWWNASGTWSIYGNIGGGVGVIDSQGVVGGQGQDFTLNWYAAAGVAHALTETLQVRVGAMFQHLSNGGATTPNPGVNTLGATIGLSWAF
ncbi:MAG TPA: acyloxyacyl hydrolase [Prosthecobacter sp.]|nr:acyloxyacyl hydrolase [Prosthecobacter sp.]